MVAGGTYKTRALVLGKTRLGERDLIVTLLSESGALLRAVAKGARKPGSSFAAKLELSNVVDIMAAHGKSLDVLTDVRLSDAYAPRLNEPERSACASAIVELLATVGQEGLEQQKLFSLSCAALKIVSQGALPHVLPVTVAALLKIISLVGYRPQFSCCQSCGCGIDLSNARGSVAFCVGDGGATCSSCARSYDVLYYDTRLLAWCQALLTSTFAQIEEMGIDLETSFGVLGLVRSWISYHTSRRMKSCDYLMSSGLF